jgi:SAM-dependent methyltransferase
MKLTTRAHCFLESIVQNGDRVLDATAGNGIDTAFLAALVGENGFVVSIDKQTVALERTSTRLQELDLQDRCMLIHGDHADIEQILSDNRLLLPLHSTFTAAMFNLGYLPGGDPSIVTNAATTLRALDATLGLLKPGGALTILVYHGQTGGIDESMVVSKWLSEHRHSLTDIEIHDSPAGSNGPTLYCCTIGGPTAK